MKWGKQLGGCFRDGILGAGPFLCLPQDLELIQQELPNLSSYDRGEIVIS